MKETFPFAANLYDGTGVSPRLEFQGDLNSCLCFGWTSAFEALAARAGKPAQYSVGFLWRYRDPLAGSSITTYAAQINRMGLVLDQHYSYEDLLADKPVPSVAWDNRIFPKVDTKLIAGRDEVMRAISTGHSIVSIRLIGGGDEHCEAIVGHHKDHGFLVHGSGNDLKWRGWDTIDQFKQMHALSCDLFPPKAFEDYHEGDQPSFELGVLHFPILHKHWPMKQAPEVQTDVIYTLAADPTYLKWDDPDCVMSEPIYEPELGILYLPTLDYIFDGKTTRVRKVVARGIELVQR